MRIISGRLKGRRFEPPAGLVSRPTAERVREALFSILYGRLEGASVLDCFSGSGALAFEALSRGAARAVCVEQDARAARMLEENAARMGVQGELAVKRGDFFRLAKTLPGPFDIVFLDPPYDKEYWAQAMETLLQAGSLGPDAVIVCEFAQRQVLPDRVGALRQVDVRRYGSVRLAFYGFESEDADADLDLPGQL